MEVVRLRTVDGMIAFDFPDVPSAGGTRYAPDVTEEETRLLARAMTYKFGVLGRPLGGAKASIRGEAGQREEILARYCAEVAPLVRSGRFLTGPDLGTSEADFAPLRDPAAPHVMESSVAGVEFEDLLTGFGVVAAAEATLGSLDGAAFGIEGFGKVGGGVAREVVRRGGRVVAVSTTDGCVVSDAGLDVELLWSMRRLYGDTCIWHVGGSVDEAPAALFDIPVEVLVPGARPGVVTMAVAERLRARAVVPAANVPYAEGAIEVLHRRGVRALADFLCNAGAVIGYLQPPTARPGEVFRVVDRTIGDLVQRASLDPAGPFIGACAIAETFLRTWRDPAGMPDARPLA